MGRMKNKIFSLVLILLLIMTLAPSCGNVARDNDGVSPLGLEEESITPSGARAELDPVPRLVFTFTVEKEAYLLAKENGTSFLGYWGEYIPGVPLDEGSGVMGSLLELGESMTDGVRYYTLGIATGRITADSYLTDYHAILVAEPPSQDTEVITLASEPYDLYSVCLREYNDRREKQTPYYAYEMPDGSYSPYADVARRADVISSYLFVEIDSGVARDEDEGEYYSSPYTIEYLDSVLTLSLPYSKIEEDTFFGLFINGEAVYYEIYKGRISLVVRE